MNNQRNPLSKQVRPNSEVHPWVYDKIMQLEAELADAIIWKQAIDDALVTRWIGTTDSIRDPKKAIALISAWDADVEKYYWEQGKADNESDPA